MAANGPTPSPKETNWAAVSAVAAVAGVLIAFMAYAIPRSASTSSPPPTPTNSGASQHGQTSTPTATSSGPIVSQPIGAPAGCQQGEAAITRYNNRVGPYNEQEAAGQALQEIGLAQAAANGSSSSTVVEDLQALYEDFLYLQDYPPGSPQNDAALARAKKDSQTLSVDCSTH